MENLFTDLTDSQLEFIKAEFARERDACDDPCCDSWRIARKGNKVEEDLFNDAVTCCGRWEWEATDANGTVWILGFNYGH